MNYNHPNRNDSAVIVRVMCAVVFVVFSFLWLYFFQADILKVAQHVLSGGRTSYKPIVGTVLITTSLVLLQLFVYKLTHLRKNLHALTYFPSMLLLAVLTSVGQNLDLQFSFGPWLWLFPLLFLWWIGSVWAARALETYSIRTFVGFFSRRMWINMLLMVLMIIGVTVAGNTNAVFHYRVHAEAAMVDQDFDEALRVGNRSWETDSCLLMVRMYALSRKGQLGDRLFAYPIIPSSKAMLPTSGQVRMMLYPVDSVYRHLGAIPRYEMHPMDYLRTIIRSGQAKPAAIDYLLCGYLIDKDLDAFARELPRYYKTDGTLPHYYREALVLYNRQRTNPVVVYHDAVLDVDYQDLQKLEATYRVASERKGKVLENYANSYWYYYFYVSSDAER